MTGDFGKARPLICAFSGAVDRGAGGSYTDWSGCLHLRFKGLSVVDIWFVGCRCNASLDHGELLALRKNCVITRMVKKGKATGICMTLALLTVVVLLSGYRLWFKR